MLKNYRTCRTASQTSDLNSALAINLLALSLIFNM